MQAGGALCAVWLHACSCDSCAFKRRMHPALCCAAVLVAWRSRRSTALRLFAPFIFLLMALVVNLALNANNSLQVRLCVWGGGRLCSSSSSSYCDGILSSFSSRPSGVPMFKLQWAEMLTQHPVSLCAGALHRCAVCSRVLHPAHPSMW